MSRALFGGLVVWVVGLFVAAGFGCAVCADVEGVFCMLAISMGGRRDEGRQGS